MKNIGKLVGDPRILELLKKYLQVGYVDKYNNVIRSKVGVPQGGTLSPLLSNIVLHELDLYMSKYQKKFKKGIKRKINPVYKNIANKRSRTNIVTERKKLLEEMRKTKRTL